MTLKNSCSVLLALASCVAIGSRQMSYAPPKTSAITVFRYKCVLPKGWVAGITSQASFLEASFRDQPIFHSDRGLALISLASMIDVDGKIAHQVMDMYAGARRRGCAIPREATPAGELYAFFMNAENKPRRMPPLQRGAKIGPRHYAQIYVMDGKRVFRVTFSSTERAVIRDALAVARAYRPLDR